MTDTTDIKALREFLECEIIPNGILRNFANKVLSQLEAERQRADKAQTDMQFECDAHIETAESWREWKLRAVTAEAEIAALKGEREEIEFDIEPEYFLPYCLKTDEISGEARTRRIKELIRWFGRYWHATANPKWFSAHTAELCYYIVSQKQLTSPQKPVVLPEKYEPRIGGNYEIELVGVPNGEVYLVSDVIAAIEAAGGIVKDGE